MLKIMVSFLFMYTHNKLNVLLMKEKHTKQKEFLSNEYQLADTLTLWSHVHA